MVLKVNMQFESRNVIRNTRALTFSYIVRKLMSFVYFMLIARFSGVNNTGLYYLLISVATVFTVFMDFGLSMTMIREASRDRGAISRYLNNVFTLKILLCFVGAAGAAGLISLIGYPEITERLMYIVLAMMAVESFTTTFYACLRVHGDMRYEARGLIFGHLLTLVLGSIAIYYHLSIFYLIAAVLSNKVFNCIYSLAYMRIKLGLFPRLSWETAFVRNIVRIAVPVFAGLAFSKLLFIDTFILSYFTNEAFVAKFAIPTMIVRSFQFIPVSLVAAMFPVLSSRFVVSGDGLRKMFENSCRYLGVFILPVSTGIAVCAHQLVLYVFGEDYSGSVLPLQIMAISLIPMFFNHAIGAVLNAANKQVVLMVVMVAAAMLNVVLVVMLIPGYGVVGVSLAALLSNMFLFTLGMICVLRILHPGLGRYLISALRVLLPSVMLGASILAVKMFANIVIAIVVGAVFYFSIAYISLGIHRNGFDSSKAISQWRGILGLVFNRV